jgi:hypothetical protein
MLGSLLKQRISIRAASPGNPCRATSSVSMASNVIPCSGLRGCSSLTRRGVSANAPRSRSPRATRGSGGGATQQFRALLTRTQGGISRATRSPAGTFFPTRPGSPAAIDSLRVFVRRITPRRSPSSVRSRNRRRRQPSCAARPCGLPRRRSRRVRPSHSPSSTLRKADSSLNGTLRLAASSAPEHATSAQALQDFSAEVELELSAPGPRGAGLLGLCLARGASKATFSSLARRAR